MTTSHDVKIYARKNDLAFLIPATKYSQRTQPNAIALANPADKRWRGGIGMVEAATPIAANSSVNVPPDTPRLTTASADK